MNNIISVYVVYITVRISRVDLYVFDEFKREIERTEVKVCDWIRKLHTGVRVSLRLFTKCVLSSCKNVYLKMYFVHQRNLQYV